MEKKYCAYLCSGCGIGDALDMEALAEVVTGEMSMDCKTAECLCGDDGRALIESDIAEGVNTVVVGACSPRVMQNQFDFGDGTTSAAPSINAGLLHGAPNCPYCDNQTWAMCACDHVHCCPETDGNVILTCPWCGGTAEYSADVFDVGRGQG